MKQTLSTVFNWIVVLLFAVVVIYSVATWNASLLLAILSTLYGILYIWGLAMKFWERRS